MLVLLTMVVASSIVDGWVWMVVVLGFGFVHGGKREVETKGEKERQKLERGRDGIGLYILL